MAKERVTIQWGVLHADGHVERISYESANEGYMTAEEYATKRASVSGGTIVSRRHTIVTEDWIPHGQ